MTRKIPLEFTPMTVFVCMILLALITPFAIVFVLDQHYLSGELWASLWALIGTMRIGDTPGFLEPDEGFYFGFTPVLIIPLSIYNIMRYWFVFMLYRYFLGETTKKRVLITGLLAVLQPPLMILLYFPFISYPGEPLHLLLPIPIPVVTVLGILLMRRKGPMIQDEHQNDLDESEQGLMTTDALVV